MTHAVAAAATFQNGVSGQYINVDGWVWCACGRRFTVYDSDALTSHIKEGNNGAEK